MLRLTAEINIRLIFASLWRMACKRIQKIKNKMLKKLLEMLLIFIFQKATPIRKKPNNGSCSEPQDKIISDFIPFSHVQRFVSARRK